MLYAASTDPGEADKRTRAREILASADWGLSMQVLQELHVNLIPPSRRAVSREDAVALIRQLMRRPVVATDSGLVPDAPGLKQRCQLAYRDAAIIAAAKALGASVLYSEDLNQGQDYGGLRVENPFRA